MSKTHTTLSRLAALTILLPLAAPTPAQSLRTSPPGYLTKEAPSAANLFGVYANFRAQFIDGSSRNLAMSIDRVDFRLDRQFYAPSILARTWAAGVLRVGPGNYTSHSIALDKNFSGSPQTVFAGKVSWPAYSSSNPPLAAPWGGNSGSFSMPFKRTWMKAKSTDMVFDFNFLSGTMPGQTSWTLQYYPIDGVHEPPYAQSRATNHGNSCRDSGQTRVAEAAPFMLAWRKQAPNPRFRGTLDVRINSFFTPPNAPVVHALGLRGNPVSIGACNPLYLAQILVLRGARADSRTVAGTVVGRATYPKALTGFSISAQAAYHDSRNGTLQLTQAGEAKVPPLPGDFSFKRVFYLNRQPSTGPEFLDHSSQPVFRLSYK